MVDTGFGRRLMLSVDAKSYGSSDDLRQHAIQAGLLAVMNRAAERSGFDRSAWSKQPGGDSELSILPHDQAHLESVLVDGFVGELAAALGDHNHAPAGGTRLRLRLAIHYGMARQAACGYSGQGVVAVSRLVDCAQAKQALTLAPDADLVVVLSDSVYGDTVAQGHTSSLRSRDFRKVVVRNKEFSQPAYLYLPNHDVHTIELTEPEAAAHVEPRQPQRTGSVVEVMGNASVINTFTDEVDATYANFGISNRSS